MKNIFKILPILFLIFFSSSSKASNFDYLKTRIIEINPKTSLVPSFSKKKYLNINIIDQRRDLNFLGYSLGNGTFQRTGKLINDQDLANILEKEIVRVFQRKGFGIKRKRKEADISLDLSLIRMNYSASNTSPKLEIVVEVAFRAKMTSQDGDVKQRIYKEIFRDESYRHPNKKQISEMFNDLIEKAFKEIVKDVEDFE